MPFHATIWGSTAQMLRVPSFEWRSVRGMAAAPPPSVRCLLVILVLAVSAPAIAAPCEPVAVWREGAHTETICAIDAIARGLTIVDLGDDWTPPILAPGPDGSTPGYRATYLALAQERFADAGTDGELATRDRYLELFGVEPTFAVVHSRLADDARHACHDAIDTDGLAAAPDRIVEESSADGRARVARARALRADLEHDRERAKVDDLDALAALDAYHRRGVARLRTLEAYIAAVRIVQAHLACDGLLESPAIDGAYSWQTSNAVETFQRGAMILPTGTFDTATRSALLAGSRERDALTALRVLRERVIAATGLVEDGTAGTGESTVLGRELVPAATWRARGHAPLADAAADLISPATEAAAGALGWSDPASIRAFLDARVESSSFVALSLPPAPAYHASAMEISVDIDRGDVWKTAHATARRPALILYATVGERRVPLARWPTTIGGWQKQKIDGDIEKRWKESPVGPRIWRDVFVGPRWLPPASTPDRELVRRRGDRFVLASEALGPSYRAAFGMIAFVHLVEEGHGELWDQGIRTHGTGSVASLAHGVSHGCHRLLGFHVVRLADFVLAHRQHVRHGDARTYYRRTVRSGGNFPIAIDSLGYRIELVPPMRVEVLRGRVHR